MAMKRVHQYHAEATVLHAKMDHPLNREIKPQSRVNLAKVGGYLSKHAQNYRVENVVSYKSAHTHVAGHKSPKPGHGWVTLSSSSIECLNVLDVVTADRVVSQIGTEHPLVGHVPTVTFLGTRFDNLRIGGVKVDLKLKFELQVLSPPDPDVSYLEDADFLGEIGASTPGGDFPEQWKKYLNVKKNAKPGASVTGSLAYDVSVKGAKVQNNVIEVPEFGKIILAELTVDCNTFHLTMLRLEMGCIAMGSMSFGGNLVNGGTQP